MKKVILISGPAGSGKTTTAKLIAQNENWVRISEDEAWIKIKEGHPVGEARTEEEELIVQKNTLETIIREIEKGNNVVLEFILYRSPPTPVIFYREELIKNNIEVITRLLKTSEDELWERKKKRGYEWDKNEEAQRSFAKHQLSCLNSDYFDKSWIIENTNISENEVYTEYFAHIV